LRQRNQPKPHPRHPSRRTSPRHRSPSSRIPRTARRLSPVTLLKTMLSLRIGSCRGHHNLEVLRAPTPSSTLEICTMRSRRSSYRTSSRASVLSSLSTSLRTPVA
jgi:hypothetical protein